MAKHRVGLIGERYGRYIITGEAQRAGRRRRVFARCTCGITKSVELTHLRSGATQSCGCLHREATSAAVTTHGQTNSREYQSWAGMIQRCHNPNSPSFGRYGARGIKVCDRWRERGGSTNFLADMGPRPEGLTLDRIDNAGPYAPDNCKWSTVAEQNRNQRSNRMLTFKGKTQCLTDWANELGMQPDCLYGRMRNGWTVERALTTPTLKRSEWTARTGANKLALNSN